MMSTLRCLAIALALTSTLSWGFAAVDADSAALQIYDRAYSLYEKGHLKGADKRLIELLEKYPDSEVADLAVYLRDKIQETREKAREKSEEKRGPDPAMEAQENPEVSPPQGLLDRKDESPSAAKSPEASKPSSSPGGMDSGTPGPGLTVTVVQVADMTLRLDQAEVEAMPGEEVRVPMSVSNLGNGEDSFSFSCEGDSRDAAMRVLSHDANEVTVTSPLQSGQTFKAVLMARIPENVVEGQKMSFLVQCASRQDPAVTRSCRLSVVTRRPRLSAAFRTDIAEAKVGGEVRWELACANEGGVNANDLRISCEYPAEVEPLDLAPQPTEMDPAARRMTWAVPSLQASDRFAASLRFKVRDNALAGQELRLWGAVASQLSPQADFLSPSVSVAHRPGVSLTLKDQKIDSTPGGLITIPLRVSNAGNGPDSLILSAEASSGVSLQVLSPDGRPAPELSDLDAFEEVELSVVVRIPESAVDRDVLRGDIVARSSAFPDAKATQTVEVVVAAPVVHVAVVAPQGQVRPGASLQVQLLCTNKGTGVAKGVMVQETFPEGLRFVSSEPMASSLRDQVVTWEIPELAPGEVFRINLESVVVPNLKAGSVLNTQTLFLWHDLNGREYR